MTVQDVILTIESIDKQARILQHAEKNHLLPDTVCPDDIIDLLTAYRVLLLGMKIEKQ